MVCVRTDAHTRGSRFFLVLLSCFSKIFHFSFLLLLLLYLQLQLLKSNYHNTITFWRRLHYINYKTQSPPLQLSSKSFRTSPRRGFDVHSHDIFRPGRTNKALLLLFLTHESNKSISSILCCNPSGFEHFLSLSKHSITVRSRTFTLVCFVGKSRYIACHSWNGMFPFFRKIPSINNTELMASPMAGFIV